jgi:hypothetical protein
MRNIAATAAHTVIVGSQAQVENRLQNLPPSYTLIDVNHPATADGTVA